jgi:hypothetical protein
LPRARPFDGSVGLRVDEVELAPVGSLDTDCVAAPDLDVAGLSGAPGLEQRENLRTERLLDRLVGDRGLPP